VSAKDAMQAQNGCVVPSSRYLLHCKTRDKSWPRAGEVRQSGGRVLEGQVFALANHCPPLRLFWAAGKKTDF